MSKRAKPIFFLLSALLLLSVAVLDVVRLILENRTIPDEEKYAISECVLWQTYHIDSAAEEAVTIVCGTLGPKSRVKAHEAVLSDGSVMEIEHYTDARIYVTQIIKGDPKAKSAAYRELCGKPDDDFLFVIPGAKTLLEGHTYLFFLNKYSFPLNPAAAIEICEDGTVTPSQNMRMDSSEAYLFDPEAPIPLEDYLAAVQRYLDESE